MSAANIKNTRLAFSSTALSNAAALKMQELYLCSIQNLFRVAS